LQQLNIETQDVEEILIELILDGKVKGKIDQQNGRIELERSLVLLILGDATAYD
jgi:hypothetical protein